MSAVAVMAVPSGWPGRLLAAIASSFEGDAKPSYRGAIEPLRRRDPEAWRVLFQDEMPAIYRYARSRLGSTDDAEDATSHVFEQAWEHAPSLRDQGLPPRAWLFGIARHVVGTYRRRWVRRPPMLALEAFDGSHDGALSPENVDLARAVNSLARSQAEVVVLRFINGLSLQETAAVLETSIEAVKGRQARALSALRKILGADFRG